MPQAPPLRIMVADDQLLVRAGIASILSHMDGVELIAAVCDGQEVLDACESAPPDVLFLDLHMPGPGGLDVARRLNQSHPRIKVVILSSSTSGADAREAINAGACGFVSKDFVMDELSFALNAVRSGQIYISPDMAAAMSRLHGQTSNDLTPRQIDVLKGIALGLTSKQIARDMGVSLKTIAYHRAALIERLNLHDVASLTRYAIEHGLTASPPSPDQDAAAFS